MDAITAERSTAERKPSLYYIPIIIVVGTLSLCLLPLVPTPANSADVAFILSSFSPRSPFPSASIHTNESTHNDDTLAALTIYLEARGESFAGKLAVAAVIRNRMNYKYHSNGTVKDTVLRPKQFEPWIGRNPEDVKYDPTNRKMRDCLLAWNLVQDGRNIVDGAVLFYNPQLVKAPRWAQVNRKVATIGGHQFFNKHTI